MASRGPEYGYGATAGQVKSPSSIFTPGKRRRMNLAAVCLNAFLPWFLFCAVFAVLSFSFHYEYPMYAWMIVCLAYVVPIISGLIAWRNKMKRDRDPMWYTFATLCFFIAAVTGTIFGDMNFRFSLQPYYDIQNLNSYPNVDPAEDKGQELMDAGKVYFTDGVGLDLKKSMGFKNNDLFCVAPIVLGAEQLASYDFWAIGKNCCSGISSDFRCGQFNNPQARSGLRLMNDVDRGFYRLAVQEAEATYGIRASHPLFFYWLQDPLEMTNKYLEDGWKHYILAVFSHFAFNIFLVVCALVGFSKVGRY